MENHLMGILTTINIVAIRMTRAYPKINTTIRDIPNTTVIMTTVEEDIQTNMHIIKIRVYVEKTTTEQTRGIIQGIIKIIPMPTIINNLGDILINMIMETDMTQIFLCHQMEAKEIDTAMKHKWAENNAIKIRMKTQKENQN